jgi:NADH-quinone oxidoreductase subunit E
VKEKYAGIIKAYRQEGLLDALLALQEADGYVTAEAMEALAEELGSTPARIYDSASFYSMLRFSPPKAVTIQICQSAPCHVAGTAEVIQALEEALGIRMGEATADGKYKLEYTECLGQCQDSPCLLVNGSLHTRMNAEKARELVGRRA